MRQQRPAPGKLSDQPLDSRQQFMRLKRFGQEIFSTSLDSPDSIRNRRGKGGHDDFDIFEFFTDVLEER